MARSRNIKPGFFKNEDLAECSVAARLCFAGLWTLADREGRLEDRPKRIKGELFAYDTFEVEPLLQELASRGGFILRYCYGNQALIQIINFSKHQNPHHKEAKSKWAAPDGWIAQAVEPEALRSLNDTIAPDQPETSPGLLPQDSTLHGVKTVLIPDSGFLIPDSLLSTTDHPVDGTVAAHDPKSAKPKKTADKTPAVTAATWGAYSQAYALRYRTPPVRNATVSSQLAQLVSRLGGEEAPQVAAFYVGHQDQFYVRKGHPVGILLSDCEKLRTEWVTSQTAGTSKRHPQWALDAGFANVEEAGNSRCYPHNANEFRNGKRIPETTT